MKKKTITTLATLATAAVILISSYISDSDKLPLAVTTQGSATQNSATQGSAIQGSATQSSATQGSATQNSAMQNSATQGSATQGSATQGSATQSSAIQSSATQGNVTQNSTENSGQLEKATFPKYLVKIQKEGIVPFGYIKANVTKVIDGDTFHIKYDKQDYKVRMLDIDSPESVKGGVDPQPYAVKASDMTKEALAGKNIKLIFEKGITDQYGRLLAHVILEDGTYYNAFMVQKGYAISVYYSPNTLLKDYFSELQSKAIESEEGFWQLPENARPFIEDSKGKFVAAYKLRAKAA